MTVVSDLDHRDRLNTFDNTSNDANIHVGGLSVETVPNKFCYGARRVGTR